MKKMGKRPLNLDERDLDIFRKVCSVMYIITIYALMGVLVYRQFVLHQPTEEWDDIANITVFNVIVCIGSLLYLGGNINPRKIKPGYIIAGYAGFVLIGLAFTIFKYTVLLGQELDPTQIVDYFFIVLKISGILAIGWGLLAHFGSKRIEKQIE
jgi:hypothetical protein